MRACRRTSDLKHRASGAPQDMQTDIAKLEKQLRTVKQERNALAATLRQHGFLGKQSSNHAALASGHKQQQVQHRAQADLCRQTTQMTCSKGSDLGKRSDVIQPGGSAGIHQPAQEARSSELEATPSPGSNTANVSCYSHPHEARCLRDTSNVIASTSASPTAKSSAHPAPRGAQMSAPGAGSPMYFNQHANTADAMQARLHELEQLAQELLL